MNIHLAAFCSRTLFIYNPIHGIVCTAHLLGLPLFTPYPNLLSVRDGFATDLRVPELRGVV